MLGKGSAFGVDVVPRPTEAAVESRAGVGEVDVEGATPAHAMVAASSRQNERRM